MAGEITYEIKKQIAVLREGKWNLELNIVSWNGGEAKYDIRTWNPEHDKCGKGVSFCREEFKNLYIVLGEVFG